MEIKPSPHYEMLYEDGKSVLLIIEVGPEDTGEYTMKATSDELGEIVSSTTLYVQGKGNIFKGGRGGSKVVSSSWARGMLVFLSVSGLSFTSPTLSYFSLSTFLLALLSLFSFLWEMTQNDPERLTCQ